MLDLTRVPPNGAPLEAHEKYLSDFVAAFEDGLDAMRAVANGGPPNVAALDGYSQALEALRIGTVATGGFLKPTEEDVRDVRQLVQLARDGAPSEALIDLARHAVRLVDDSSGLQTFQAALFGLEDEALRTQHLARILAVLDQTVALFERGCRAAGFVSTPADAAAVRRLREVAVTAGPEALEERQRLGKELQARLPREGGLDVDDRWLILRALGVDT